MKLHVKWREDGHIELKEFLTTKQIFCSQQEISGDVQLQLLELAMTLPDTLTLGLLLLASTSTTTMISQIWKED